MYLSPMASPLDKKMSKMSNSYFCEYCDYNTSRKVDYEKHLLTPKHEMLVNAKITSIHKHFCECGKSYKHIESLYRHKKSCNGKKHPKHKNENPKKVANCFQMFPKRQTVLCECECGKTYKTRSGLWKHQKICRYAVESIQVVKANETEVLEMLGSLNAKLDRTCEDNQVLKQDNQLLKEELNQLKSGVLTAVAEPKIVNNNYNNIIVLLNQKCGEAVAITDFAKEIAMCMEDVDYALENGKVKGIENIIRKKFEELGTYKRPLHCTDVKRGTMYVKGEEGWEKEKGEINKMIEDVECLQTRGIKVWEKSNPGFVNSNPRLMDKWLRIVKCLTSSIDGNGKKRIEKRCHEMCKIDQIAISE